MNRPAETRDETLFIADLHLDPERPATLALFQRFLAERAPRAAALYILGDLFEAWVGDDDDTPAYRTVLTALRDAADAGTALFVMPGNRDFLLGERFAADAGCRLIPDPTLVERHGERLLLLHGDTLCSDDHAYQQFRRQVRDPQWREAFLARPLAERKEIAAGLRRQSREAIAGKSHQAMDAAPAAVAAALAGHRAEVMIHGHTHRQGFHPLADGGRRYVLGDWSGEAGSVLVWGREGLRFEIFTG